MARTTQNPHQTFKQAYAELNPAQKQAVDQIEGPVMVVAGPGTGKTQILTTRIAKILEQTDTNPQSILALTFTQSAAKNMRTRLAEMIGKTAYYVQISTFHSFASEVISSHPEYFSIARESQTLTDLERYKLFENIIFELNLEVLKPINDPFFYIKDIISSISDLKREGVDVQEFKQILENEAAELDRNLADLKKTEQKKRLKNLAKNQELLLIYQDYQKKLRETMRYDYDDMVALVDQAFTDHELLLREYQENLLYFLVDEYQDTNSAQNQIVDLLASYWQDSANIFVVGDPNQAIYRFQGASMENMLSFVDRYPKAKVIHLDTGYRCPQNLYDNAAHLITFNYQDSDKQLSESYQNLIDKLSINLKSIHPKADKIKLYQAPVQTIEAHVIALQIQKLLEKKVPAEEIAVLFRYNSDREAMIDAMQQLGIGYEIEGGGDILKTPEIDQLLTLFEVIVDLRQAAEADNLFNLLNYDFVGLDSLTVMKLTRLAAQSKLSLVDVIEKDFDELQKMGIGSNQNSSQTNINIDQQQFSRIKHFYLQLIEWNGDDAKLPLTDFFEKIIKESGFMNWVMESDFKLELLTNLNSFYSQIKSLVSAKHNLKLTEFLETINTMKDNGIAISPEDLNIRKDAVHISTVHKAKGREWDYVFLISFVDKKWGNARSRDMIPLPDGILKNTDLSKKERNEDERRLFYVAMTRAKKQFMISYPDTVVADNQSRDLVPSLFLEEVDQLEKIEQIDHQQLAEEYLNSCLQVAPRKVVHAEKEFYKKIIDSFKLSVTALNDYLRDPQIFIENHLLRVPRAKHPIMSFGTAVHKALETWSKYYQQFGQIIAMNDFLLSFENALKNEILTEEEFKKRLKYGRQILTNYYQHYQTEKYNPLFVEKFFGSGFSRVVVDGMTLTGRIDRVDLINQSKKTVRVIDFKTGKSKTNGQIEGKTKSSNLSEREQQLPESIRGSYKRQLLFYKLLTKLDKSFNFEVIEGCFDFVEPNKTNGKFIRRNFVLDDEEIRQLLALVKQVIKEIKNLEFLA